MEHKIDEAAVWQRVAGSASRSANESPRPVTIAPVLREIWEEMELSLIHISVQSNLAGFA